MANELTALQQQVGFSFPADTQLLGVERSSGMDDMVRFKISIPRASWPAVESTLPVKATEMVHGPGPLGPDRGWWDPESAASLRSGYKNLSGGRAIRIAVDESRPEMVILYVLEHGT